VVVTAVVVTEAAVTRGQAKILLDAGWKPSATTPGYWVDPLKGKVFEPLVALRIVVDGRHNCSPDSNQEQLDAVHNMHQQSKNWRERKSRRTFWGAT
jgi:hypothetical protein